MSANDIILLEDMVNRSRSETAHLSAAEQEAYFVAKHYLNQYRPGHDDLLAGIVDGTHDGGLDGVYIFANGYCIRDDTDVSGLGRNVTLDLVLLQVKNTKGFSESSVEKLITNLPYLLAFDRDEGELAKRFNPRVLEISRRFLNAYRSLELPALNIYVAFASLRADQVHENVEVKGRHLEEALRTCFGSCRPAAQFLGATDVADLARTPPLSARQLALAENPISTDMAGGYIGVVALDEYQRFITDGTGKLDASLFEANVRDYEGEKGVNQSIQETLQRNDANVDFWWLNNGVTIVADQVQLAGKLLDLLSPQVVNGLQTSHEIYKRGSGGGREDSRSVLLKVIQAADDRVKDRIIRATNSQTTLGISSLRATDKVQRQIEEHLKNVGLFYERRKNFYHNRNIPLHNLVSIDQMGQALLAAVAQLPHVARGSSSRIFDEEVYDLLFSEQHPIHMFSAAIQMHRVSEEFLRDKARMRGNVEDFAFHLTTFASIAVTRKNRPRAQDIAVATLPDEAALRGLLPMVQEVFAYVADRRGEVLLDRVAKDPLTTERLLERAQRYLQTTARI